MLRRLENSDVTRPALVLSTVFVALLSMAFFMHTSLDARSAYSVLQYFATLAPVALGLGLTMIAREYDLSVGSTLGLAGCVAVIAGAGNPYLGLLCGVGAGLLVGLVQGALIVGLRMSSIPVTLGGLLTIGAVSYVITGNQTITYPDLDVAMAVNAPVFGILSERSLIAVACFVVAASIVTYTRIGRDLAASGSDRKAATTAGVRTGVVLVLVFMTSGGLSAFSGVLLSYSLAAASPVGLTDILVPATAASIIGGVSLSGGRGHPMGIAAGVMTLCVLNAGLNALGASPFVQNVVMGGVLLAVAVSDAPLLLRRLRVIRQPRSTTVP
jgi:ribose transport system permease protein